MNDSANPNTPADPAAVEQFISRWQNADGKERANYQLFLTELAQLLGLPGPEPAGNRDEDNAYVFERRVDIQHPDGSTSRGYIDLYKRGHFVLEAKRISEKAETSRWDKAMLRAAAQADTYIRALPASEGRPPFLLTCDVGQTIEIYAEFTRSGATYVPFPDPRTHRIGLQDLRKPEIQDRLIGIWTNPDALDPNKRAARVTRNLSRTLAGLAKALEKDGYAVERVAHFIKRCLFTMFAEDVDLLPKGQFTALLQRLKDTPEHFADALKSLWDTMHTGGYSGALNARILHFNGALFHDINPIPLSKEQIELLIDAARHDWSAVEPAIFGTLLERALDPEERHKLGAHYTPRAYVERLVMPTIIDPLRDEWKTVQAAAVALERQGKVDQAVAEIRTFHHQLCDTRVLDPACGTANFLYVTLEHMKRLEGEVLTTLADLGAGQNLLEMQGNTVDPHQFLGIEINPRAAAIAEMVLWIGYLQWHFRTHGHINPPQPVLKAFKNIECRDAVLAYDRQEYQLDETGRPVMRWDGKTYKKSPTTGENIPDESARLPVEVYVNPRKAEWPEADYILGNPPFIGTKRMRAAFGDGYVDALRETYKKDVPNSADFVMYWWQIAAEKVRNGDAVSFGLITTNSIGQSFNRRVVEPHLSDKKPLSIVFAIPDHPWVDSAEGAAVRISMTVAIAGNVEGVLSRVHSQIDDGTDSTQVTLDRIQGKIASTLRVGANVGNAHPLLAGTEISGMGSALHGAGFIIDVQTAERYRPYGETVVRPYLGGRDLLQIPREQYVIDFSGMRREQAQDANPAAFQHVIDRVKPGRDQNRREPIRRLWWRFGWERPKLRAALRDLDRFIGTTETSKHRIFQFIPATHVADHMIVCIAIDQSSKLGILSSRLHSVWALATGGTLEDRPRYNKSRCLETFPFPTSDEATTTRIATLAKQLDTHRKRQQEQHPGLTMTGMYNVLERLRRQTVPGSDEPPLTAKEKEIHEQGLVSVLRELHDDLDRAVFQAYGWQDLGEKLVGRPGATTPWPEKPEDQQQAEEELLQRLVDLNHQRAAEEAQGKIRWLRPDYQAPDQAPEQTKIATDNAAEQAPATPAAAATKHPWPKTLQAQIRAIRTELTTTPTTSMALASRFKRNPEKSVTEVLAALTELGMAQRDSEGQYRKDET